MSATPETIIKNRTIETHHDTGHDNERGRAVLVIRTSHQSHRKSFASKVTRITKHAIGYIEVSGFREPGLIPHGERSVHRYSEKALRETHGAYIAEHHLDNEHMLAELIEWAKGAKG